MTYLIKIILFTLILYTLHTLSTLNLYSQLVSDFKVNDDTTNFAQYLGRVGSDGNGNFVVVWTDFRYSPNLNLFGQLYHQSGSPKGNNFRINDSLGVSFVSTLAVRKNGSFLICWEDLNLKARLYNADGLPITTSFIINDSSNRIHTSPAVGVDSLGNFIITWAEYISLPFGDIYVQRLDSLGNKLGNNLKVNDDIGNSIQEHPDITVRYDGSFIICWDDTRSPAGASREDVYIQIFDKNANRIGTNTKVNDNIGQNDAQYDPKISSDSLGRFSVAFTEYILNSNTSNIVCQLFNSNGTRKGGNFGIIQTGANSFLDVLFRKRSGDMLIGFRSSTVAGYLSFFQKIDTSGNLIANQYLLTNKIIESFYSGVTIHNDRIISVWTDNRYGNLDVLCNIRSFRNPDTIVAIQNNSNIMVDDFYLNQNYPNPFNPKTKITFSIPRKTNANLRIFNSIGQKIREFSFGNISPGYYEANFDGTSFSSGIYYYKLETDYFTDSKLMILLK